MVQLAMEDDYDSARVGAIINTIYFRRFDKLPTFARLGGQN